MEQFRKKHYLHPSPPFFFNFASLFLAVGKIYQLKHSGLFFLVQRLDFCAVTSGAFVTNSAEVGFLHLHSQINLAAFLLHLKEWLQSKYLFLTAAVLLAALSGSLGGDLSHPKLPSQKLPLPG